MFPIKSVKLSREYKEKENILNPAVNLGLWNYSIEVINDKVVSTHNFTKSNSTKENLVFPKEIYCYFTIIAFSHVNYSSILSVLL